MSYQDEYPTCYNLKPVTLEKPSITDVDLTASILATRVANMRYEKPSITDVELAALRGVDLAERVAEPVNRFSVARAAIKLSAHTARKFR